MIDWRYRHRGKIGECSPDDCEACAATRDFRREARARNKRARERERQSDRYARVARVLGDYMRE